jgi:signal transduction histidine kinase/ligand-binding sensor domain-containing protein
MWFGTPNGLCRYDGNNFQTFKCVDTASKNPINNFVRGKILEDSSGNIWYSNESGIYKWDKNSETIYLTWRRDLPTNKNSEYRAFLIDSKQQLWVFNLFEGLIKYNISTRKMTNFPFPFKTNMLRILHTFIEKGPDNKIWLKIGDDKAPLISFDLKDEQYSMSKNYNEVNSVYFDGKRKMLVYKDKLIIHDDSNQENRISGNSDLKISPVFGIKSGIKDSYGRWWFTSEKGLKCYDENKKVLSVYTHNNLKLKSLPFDVTTCVYIDRNDNLWIGTDGGGVARLDLKRPRFNIFPLSLGDYPILKDYFTKCFFEDEERKIWFGTYSSGLNIYNPADGSLINYKHNPRISNSLPGNIVGAIFRDKDKNMWVGTNAGLSIFNSQNSTFRKISIKNDSQLFPDQGTFINKIIQLKNGDILCATTKGLLKIKRKSAHEFTAETLQRPFTHTFSIDIFQSANGDIFLAQPMWGIFHLKPNGEDFDPIDNFLIGIDIRSISSDLKNNNYLWVASGIGLIHYNLSTHTYQLYDENQGMGDNYAYGSLEDSKGNLWISTNKGLSFFDTKNKKFENYSYLNGLQSNEFNTQAFYRGESGNFYFGGVKGFNWFNANSENEIKSHPRAAITSIEINNKKLANDSNYLLHNLLSVAHDHNYFSFNFAALDFTLPDANKIKYQLTGWDQYPVITANKSARYPNLPPGNYQLKFQVSNAEGQWSDEKVLKILVNAPYWQTKPFIAFMIVSFLLLVIYITYVFSRINEKNKIRLLEKQVAVNAERLRISADMHDEIGSSITHIALLSEIVQSQHKGELKKEMKMISNSAQRLVQTIGEIVWALNPQNDTLENLLAYMREQSQQYFEPFDKEFIIDFPEEIPPIKLTNEVRRNLYLVTKELLNNSLKHANASIISLRFSVENGQLTFQVTDNGSGLSEAKKKSNANGMNNLKRRMSDIGGAIVWQNKMRGTEVNYTMPIKRHTTFFTS